MHPDKVREALKPTAIRQEVIGVKHEAKWY
jgi:hypothetical protein